MSQNDAFYATINPQANGDTGSDLEELAGLHQELLGNRGLLNEVSGTDGIPGLTYGTNLEIKHPWIDEPVGAVPFDPQSSIALPAGSGDTLVLTFPVPIGYDGVIEYISCNFTGGGFTQSSGDIVWRLENNGKPILNFSNITSEKGTIFQGRKIGRLRIYSGQTINWVVNHVSNPSLNGNIVCSFTGYLYPNRGN